MIGKTWGKSLRGNHTLIHLDLSNNGLSEVSCKIIGQEIVHNQTLYGLHMQGNACYVNCFGHIKFEEDIVKATNHYSDNNNKLDKQLYTPQPKI